MGRLERHLDTDLIERMESGWTPSARVKQAKKAKQPRIAGTYRGAMRNAILREPPKSVWPNNPKVTYIPYSSKPLYVFRYRGGRLMKIPGMQPKVYPYSSERQDTREKRRLQRLGLA